MDLGLSDGVEKLLRNGYTYEESPPIYEPPKKIIGVVSLEVVEKLASCFKRAEEEREVIQIAGILTGLRERKRKRKAHSASSSKPKKKRRRTTNEQLNVLDKIFEKDTMPNSQLRISLAEQLDMTPRRVQIWFQNKRAKLKRNGIAVKPGTDLSCDKERISDDEEDDDDDDDDDDYSSDADSKNEYNSSPYSAPETFTPPISSSKPPENIDIKKEPSDNNNTQPQSSLVQPSPSLYKVNEGETIYSGLLSNPLERAGYGNIVSINTSNSAFNTTSTLNTNTNQNIMKTGMMGLPVYQQHVRPSIIINTIPSRPNSIGTNYNTNRTSPKFQNITTTNTGHTSTTTSQMAANPNGNGKILLPPQHHLDPHLEIKLRKPEPSKQIAQPSMNAQNSLQYWPNKPTFMNSAMNSSNNQSNLMRNPILQGGNIRFQHGGIVKTQPVPAPVPSTSTGTLVNNNRNTQSRQIPIPMMRLNQLKNNSGINQTMTVPLPAPAHSLPPDWNRRPPSSKST